MPEFSLNTIDVCFIFIFILMCYLLKQDRTHNKQMYNRFVCLMLTALGFFTINVAGLYVHTIPGTYRWCELISSLKYILKPAMLCEILLIAERGSTKRRKLLLTIPLMILVLVMAVSAPFRWVFEHDPITNAWDSGPLLPITWITLLIYMAMIIISSIRLHGFREESQLLVIGESFILFNIINERVLQILPDMESTVIMVAILAYYCYHRSHSEAEYKVIKEKELSQARIQAMISQIKPHFIYNSLACIAETCHNDAAKGEEAIITFSGYLRNCFGSLTDDGLVPFSEELKTIENYLLLEKMQAPDKLTVVYDIKERHFQVPVLSIETLVENAVKHGIRKKHGHGSVTLRTERRNRAIVVSIIDDGIGFDTEKQLPGKDHLGLNNAKMRLAEQCKASMEVTSQPNVGTAITIIIPEDEHK